MSTRMFPRNQTSTSHRPSSVVAASVSNGCSRQPRSLSHSAKVATNLMLSASDSRRLLRQQALTSAKQGRYEDAIALFDQLIEQDPNSASHYSNRGLMHFHNGQLERALADYNQAIQLDPQLAKVYNNRANCYAALGNRDAAIADYEIAIDLDPANIHAWINQGITFRELGQFEQAIENFDLALQVNQLLSLAETAETPTQLEGHIYAERGRAHHLTGDWNYAVADYQRAIAGLSHSADSNSVSQRLRSQVKDWLQELLGSLCA